MSHKKRKDHGNVHFSDEPVYINPGTSFEYRHDLHAVGIGVVAAGVASFNGMSMSKSLGIGATTGAVSYYWMMHHGHSLFGNKKRKVSHIMNPFHQVEK